jgi:hypothetical protein
VDQGHFSAGTRHGLPVRKHSEIVISIRTARQIRGGKRQNRRKDKADDRQAARKAPPKAPGQGNSGAGRKEAGGKTRNQKAASKQVLGRRNQKEAAKTGEETATFAVSNWVSGY